MLWLVLVLVSSALDRQVLVENVDAALVFEPGTCSEYGGEGYSGGSITYSNTPGAGVTFQIPRCPDVVAGLDPAEPHRFGHLAVDVDILKCSGRSLLD